MRPRSLLVAFAVLVLATLTRAEHDNVLLVVVDDWGVDSCAFENTSASGASLPPTPTIASLAANGLRFSHAYAHPMCSPSRAAMLTGCHGYRTTVQQIAMPGHSLRPEDLTLPEAFAAQPSAGYALASFGKWHLTSGLPALDPTPCTIGGWRYFAGFLAATVGSYTDWPKVVTDGTPGNTSRTMCSTYQTSAVVDDALAWIGAQDAAGAPWFAWVAFAAPHAPWHKPPAALCPSHAQLSGDPADAAANPRPYYEAMLEALDTELARLLAGVDRARTNVIVVADNGTPNPVLQPPCAAGRGKGTLYEGGLRVPLVVHGPAVVAPGRVSDEPVHVVDLFATILELAGIRPADVVPPGHVIDSRSLMPIVAGASSPRTRVYAELGEQADPSLVTRALRDERYKLIDFPSAPDEFYDLAADPWESANLLAGPLDSGAQAHFDVLRRELPSWDAGTGAPFCSGDGATGAHTTACPCGNAGAVGHGCANSVSAWGAKLVATGHAEAGDVALHATNLSGNTFALFLQHDAGGERVFHDGVLCAGGTLVRLRVRASVLGGATFPDAALDGSLTLAQRGGVALGGGARYYSAWYRNAAVSFCPPATSNVTNGWRIDW